MSLQEARIRRFWSIRDLAAAAGVATKTVVDIEAGRIAPRYVTMRKIATALEIEPTEIGEFATAVQEAIDEGKDAA